MAIFLDALSIETDLAVAWAGDGKTWIIGAIIELFAADATVFALVIAVVAVGSFAIACYADKAGWTLLACAWVGDTGTIDATFVGIARDACACFGALCITCTTELISLAGLSTGCGALVVFALCGETNARGATD